MANYANQKRIEITNVEPIFYKTGQPVGNGFYHTIYYDYVDKAAELLNGNAFKLWFYLIRWYNQGWVDFSPAKLKDCMGMSKSSANDARNELINKGFLIEDPEHPNKLIFTPISTKYV